MNYQRKKVNDDFETKAVEYAAKIEILDKRQEVDKLHKPITTTRSNFWLIC
jgi:hypothetical protein